MFRRATTAMALTGLVFLPFQQQRQRCAGVLPHVARHLAPNAKLTRLRSSPGSMPG